MQNIWNISGICPLRLEQNFLESPRAAIFNLGWNKSEDPPPPPLPSQGERSLPLLRSVLIRALINCIIIIQHSAAASNCTLQLLLLLCESKFLLYFTLRNPTSPNCSWHFLSPALQPLASTPFHGANTLFQLSPLGQTKPCASISLIRSSGTSASVLLKKAGCPVKVPRSFGL